MNIEDKYLRDLMQELPKEKAPEGITAQIMHKIVTGQVCAPVKKELKWWQIKALYVISAIVVVEGWLLWKVKQWLTLAQLETTSKKVYVEVYKYFATNDFSLILTIAALTGLFVYLFVRERLEATKSFSTLS